MASTKLVIDSIRQACIAVELRYEGYHSELSDTLMSILLREREHRMFSTNVQQKIQEQIELLGDKVQLHSKNLT